MVKTELLLLNRAAFSDVGLRVQECSKNLTTVQNQIFQRDVNQNNLDLERNLRVDYDKFCRAEMELLKGKARMTWLANGDVSTSFFSRSVVSYKNKMKLSMLEDDQGNVIMEPAQLKNMVVKIYENLFSSKGSLSLSQKETIKGVITTRVPEEFFDQLVAQPTHKEINDSFFSQSSGKSPGPDGYGIEFYKTNWKLIEQDMYQALTHIFATGEIPARLNATTIFLIPKSENPRNMIEYRPIS
ncbi:hypothetical protein LIER_38760 [Lithospermum erythrorhizon]|uniref:Reverse transcriptase n=1 Tax=Lithospermum erythrorhizon TaxID=34254 RepID=A0AAV3Q8I2_LITER